jgi:hypothetical protein
MISMVFRLVRLGEPALKTAAGPKASVKKPSWGPPGGKNPQAGWSPWW